VSSLAAALGAARGLRVIASGTAEGMQLLCVLQVAYMEGGYRTGKCESKVGWEVVVNHVRAKTDRVFRFEALRFGV
jgi:hypothetical protein